MPLKRITQGLGIVTDPSALEAGMAPKGAMRQADNVILHRNGAIQPRLGFGDTTGVTDRTSAYYPVGLWPYLSGARIAVQSYNGSTWRLEWLDADTQISTTNVECSPPDVDERGRSAFIEARGSIWHTNARGIWKLTESATTVHQRAGIWQTYQPLSNSLIDPGASSDRVSIDSSAADSTVAYRWLVRREDENGYVMRGPPGSRSLITALNSTYTNGAYNNLNGGTNLALPAEAVAGDVIEVYRTPNSSGDPGEDYYLCATYTITASDISAGFITSNITDDVSDANLGVALYTSSSQLGALAAKAEPPLANHLAWWKGVAWAGNGQDRRTIRVTLNKVAFDGSPDRLEGVGLCVNETISGDFTSGSPTVTNVTFGTEPDPTQNGGSVVGMWVGDSAPGVTTGTIPSGTKVLSISGTGPYTLTLDQNATANQSGFTFKIGDTLTVEGVDFYAYDTEIVASRAFDTFSGTDTLLADRVYKTAVSIAAAVNYQAALGNVDVYVIKDELLSGGDGELLFIRAHAYSGEFEVRCESRPQAWSQSEIGDGIDAPSSSRPDRLWWSAPDEPAAWPPANFTRVGEDGRRILALVPLDDALIVFKDDGIYRVTGAPPNGWVVDRIDTTKRLVAPEAVCVLDGVCYAWTDRGVVPVTEGGVGVPISGAIAHTLREYQRALPRGTTGHKRGIWMQAHPRLGVVVLNVASTPTSATPDAGQFVWHQATGAWSTWSRTGDTCSAYDPDEDRVLVGWGTSDWAAFYERSDEDNSASYRDQNVADVRPSSWTDTTTVVIAKTDVPWTPTVCDVLESDGGTAHTITAVVDTDPTWTLTLGSAVSSTTCDYFLTDEAGDYVVDEAGDRILLESGVACDVDLHEGYSQEMLWQTQHLPGMGNRWQEIHAQLLDGDSAYLSSWTLELGGQTENDSAPLDVDATISSDVTLSRPVRVGVPRDMVRATHVYPYAKVCAAGVLWRLGELHYHHTPTSKRVRR